LHGSLAQFFDFIEIFYIKVENFQKSIFLIVQNKALKNIQNEVELCLATVFMSSLVHQQRITAKKNLKIERTLDF
jgi:hypothetical protein